MEFFAPGRANDLQPPGSKVIPVRYSSAMVSTITNFQISYENECPHAAVTVDVVVFTLSGVASYFRQSAADLTDDIHSRSLRY